MINWPAPDMDEVMAPPSKTYAAARRVTIAGGTTIPARKMVSAVDILADSSFWMRCCAVFSFAVSFVFVAVSAFFVPSGNLQPKKCARPCPEVWLAVVASFTLGCKTCVCFT